MNNKGRVTELIKNKITELIKIRLLGNKGKVTG